MIRTAAYYQARRSHTNQRAQRVRRIGQQLDGQRQTDHHQQRLDQVCAIADGEAGADAGAEELGDTHHQADLPVDDPGSSEDDEAADVGGEVEQLGVRRRLEHAVAARVTKASM